jgi:hypothetical protein
MVNTIKRWFKKPLQDRHGAWMHCRRFILVMSWMKCLQEAAFGQLTVDALRTIYRIAANTYPNENPSFPLSGDNNQKAASVQSAVWYHSDPGWILDPAEPRNDATVLANYNQILQWVDGNDANGEFPVYPNDPIASLDVDPENATGEVGDLVGPFTIKISDAASRVKVTVTNGVAVDSAGNAIDPNYEYSNNEGFYIVSDAPGTATAEITGDVVAPPGRVFLAPERQRLFGLKDFAGETTVVATATILASTTTTTTTVDVEGTSVTTGPATTAAPVDVDNNDVQVGGESVTAAAGALPATGFNGMSAASLALGVALLALGITLNALSKMRSLHS